MAVKMSVKITSKNEASSPSTVKWLLNVINAASFTISPS